MTALQRLTCRTNDVKSNVVLKRLKSLRWKLRHDHVGQPCAKTGEQRRDAISTPSSAEEAMKEECCLKIIAALKACVYFRAKLSF